MRHNLCVTIFLFSICCLIVVLFEVVLEIVAQGVCLCVTSPRATLDRQDIFVDLASKKHLFVAYLPLIASCLIKMSLKFTTKLYQEFFKSRT